MLQVVSTAAEAAAAAGGGIEIADALKVCVAAALTFLIMRQVPAMAQGLASGVALSGFGAVGGVVRLGLGLGRARRPAEPRSSRAARSSTRTRAVGTACRERPANASSAHRMPREKRPRQNTLRYEVSANERDYAHGDCSAAVILSVSFVTGCSTQARRVECESALKPINVPPPASAHCHDCSTEVHEHRMMATMPLERYFAEAASWDADRVAMNARSARIAWRIATGACVLTLAWRIVALMLLMPLKRVDPFVIRVDNATGIVDVVPVFAGHAPMPEVVTRYFLDHYVTVCERFNFSTAESDYEECASFHAPARNQAWMHALGSQRTRARRSIVYKDGTSVRAQVSAISSSSASNGVEDWRRSATPRRGASATAQEQALALDRDGPVCLRRAVQGSEHAPLESTGLQDRRVPHRSLKCWRRTACSAGDGHASVASPVTRVQRLLRRPSLRVGAAAASLVSARERRRRAAGRQPHPHSNLQRR